MSAEFMDAKQLAQYLHINEKQVYALVGEGKLPGTKVTGKWLFPKQLIDNWIVTLSQKNLQADANAKTKLDKCIDLMGSNDLVLETLAQMFHARFPQYAMALSNLGSIAGLIALNQGLTHLTAVHLFHAESGTYNQPYINEYVKNFPVVSINLMQRVQGLMTAPGNPKNIKQIADLYRPDVSFINRQAGSGTRILFDHLLNQAGLKPEQINGYQSGVYTHMDVGIGVFGGNADAGLGIYPVAGMLNLEFIPLAEEQFDLVIPEKIFFEPEIQALLKVIRCEEFKAKLGEMKGYLTTNTGVLWENKR